MIRKTPLELGITKKQINQPTCGWKQSTYYIVDAAFSSGNPIHRRIIYTGFLDEKGNPSGYSGFLGGCVEDPQSLSEAFYLQPIAEINMDANKEHSL